MNPRSKLFQGNFLHGKVSIFTRNKQSSRPFCSSDSTATTPTSQSLNIPSLSELISKQHWSELKTHLKLNPTSSTTLLHHLLSSEADPELTLRYFNWSQKEFRLSHPLELSFRLLHSLANAKKYSKMRALLDSFVKVENVHSNSLILHVVSMCGNSFCANSMIVDMLLLAYVRNRKTHLGLEVFKRAGDYGFRLSVFSCNPLLSGLVKESAIGDVEYVFKEIRRRKIEPDVITFNVVVNGLCKVGKLNKAGDVIEDMKVWGFSLNVLHIILLLMGIARWVGWEKCIRLNPF